MRSAFHIALAIGADGALPTEFRLFKAGWNDTTKGKFLFDAKAAAETMAAYEKWGVDRMIDLEHQSLAQGIPADPTAKDARGWCKLELRNGELWSVGVTWTEDGAARLTGKRQRFVSPAFEFDTETKRVLSVINVALVAIPATHDTQALVAASAQGNMDPKLIASALDALIKGDAKACMDILKGVVAAAAGASADPDAATEDAPPPAGDGGADEPAEMAAAAPPPPAAADPNAPPPEKEKKAEVAAAGARLTAITGTDTFSEAVDTVEVWRTSHLELESGRAQLASDRAVLESAERRKGCVSLVTLAGHAPAAVWHDETSQAPKKYLAAMPIEDFRAHVADQIKANKGRKPAQITPPFTEAGVDVNGLTAAQLSYCKDAGCDPKVFAEIKGISVNANNEAK